MPATKAKPSRPVYTESSCRVQKVKLSKLQLHAVRMNSDHTFRLRHDHGSIRPSGRPSAAAPPQAGRALRPDESVIMPSPSSMIVQLIPAIFADI